MGKLFVIDDGMITLDDTIFFQFINDPSDFTLLFSQKYGDFRIGQTGVLRKQF
jgi:hypothetical protein